ncbi:hypothetical protein GCM10010124_24920 [Pilimelia terevasa]|uniref:GtrA/DPMS transmembrane domain-containing protein n=1 Tax=Pilimelia terevasa TaxID=53372 RepID=A0A8J3FI38_9ACTN|nr:hypothetical protein GCM10010124_24920 [Pilimelia terevasa]
MRPARPLAQRPRTRAAARQTRSRAPHPRPGRQAAARPGAAPHASAPAAPRPAWVAALLGLLPAKLRTIGPEAARFLIVGLLNTVVNFAVFNALIFTVFGNGQLKANVAATAVATVMSYLMNRHWTYQHRPRSQKRREFTLFVFFNLAGLAIELLVLFGVKYGLGLTAILAINAAKVLGLVLGTVFRFWAYRTFVFIGTSVTVPAPQPRRAQDADIDREFTALTGPLVGGRQDR